MKPRDPSNKLGDATHIFPEVYSHFLRNLSRGKKKKEKNLVMYPFLLNVRQLTWDSSFNWGLQRITIAYTQISCFIELHPCDHQILAARYARGSLVRLLPTSTALRWCQVQFLEMCYALATCTHGAWAHRGMCLYCGPSSDRWRNRRVQVTHFHPSTTGNH